MRTSVEAFKFGLAAFVVPFMFFYSQALLMQGSWLEILHVFATACLGVYLLSAAVQAWFFGPLNAVMRVLLLAGALAMIKGGLATDIAGLVIAVGVFVYQKGLVGTRTIARGLD